MRSDNRYADLAGIGTPRQTLRLLWDEMIPKFR
jgi:hypothetical protein